MISVDEALQIREWMISNQAAFSDHCQKHKSWLESCHDRSTWAQPIKTLMNCVKNLFASLSSGIAPLSAEGCAWQEESYPLSFAAWLHRGEFATKTWYGGPHDFVITLNKDIEFSHVKLDPTGQDPGARVLLPAGSSWTYVNGALKSFTYPGGKVTWEAEDTCGAYDEDGQYCAPPDEPWSPSFLELHRYRVINSDVIPSSDTCQETSIHGEPDAATEKSQ